MDHRPKVLLLLLALLTAAPLQAADGLGLGVIIGEPTGLTLKNWLDRTSAYALSAEWKSSAEDRFELNFDYLIHDFTTLRAQTREAGGEVALYYGPGLHILLREDPPQKERDDVAGVRVPLGIAFYPQKTQLELFAELVPEMDLVPDSDFNLGLALGLRYYF